MRAVECWPVNAEPEEEEVKIQLVEGAGEGGERKREGVGRPAVKFGLAWGVAQGEGTQRRGEATGRRRSFGEGKQKGSSSFPSRD